MTFLTMAMDKAIIADNMTDWLTSREASERSGYSVQYVQRLYRQGKIEGVVKGGTLLINPKSIDDYTNKMKSLGTDKFNWRRED